MQTLNFSILEGFLSHSDGSSETKIKGRGPLRKRCWGKTEGDFLYLLARSLPLGAPLKSSPVIWRIFYLFFPTATLAEQQRLLLPNMKERTKFPKARRSKSFPLFPTSEPEESQSSASECKNNSQFSGTPRAATSCCPTGLGKGSLCFCHPGSEPSDKHSSLGNSAFFGWLSRANELIPARAEEIIWRRILSLLSSCSLLLFHSPTPQTR